jgi:hypothetical protein
MDIRASMDHPLLHHRNILWLRCISLFPEWHLIPYTRTVHPESYLQCRVLAIAVLLPELSTRERRYSSCSGNSRLGAGFNPFVCCLGNIRKHPILGMGHIRYGIAADDNLLE